MRTVATAAAASTTNAAATAAAATTPAIACTAVAFGSSTSLSIFARFTVFAGLSRALVTARDLVGWPVETLHLLAERLDFALVSSFLALRFFDKFEELVHGFRGVAQDDERRFDFLHCLADARRRGGMSWRRRWFRPRLAVLFVLRRSTVLASRAGLRA